MLSLANFFGILTHNLIKSHVRDGSRHPGCCRASFYNDVLLYMGKALVEGARGKLRASRSVGTGETCFVTQGMMLVKFLVPALFIPFHCKL